MNDLSPFVRRAIDDIISAKESRNRLPCGATLGEVMDVAASAVREAMNALAASGDYELHYNVNKMPFLTHAQN